MYPGIVVEVGEHGIVNAMIDAGCQAFRSDPACAGCRASVVDLLVGILDAGADDTHVRVVRGYLAAARPAQDQIDAAFHATDMRDSPCPT